MYPNPQDVLPLPPRPSVEHYRKRAKELAKACRDGGDAIRTWALRWIETVNGLQADLPGLARQGADRNARQLAKFATERLSPVDCALSQAQFVIARAHGFASWPTLVNHIDQLSRQSDRSAFERAADAIISGDLATVEQLLAEHPEMVRARSDREHKATLLHYVAANGVENYRQKTPANIVTIARHLLDAGAAVDAEADMYGGGATTLGLAVTSAHPRAMKVQNALADLLLERGARIDARTVSWCLMNGCPEAAAHMAERGAPFGVVEAAGIGRLDVLARAFEQSPGVSPADAASALMMAVWYDQRESVTFLLDRGVDVGARAPTDGDTALHVTAYQGNVALTGLLLERGAPVNLLDGVYGTPPLVWALHAWLVDRRGNEESYRAIVQLLLRAGADVQREWIDDDRLRADPELYEALEKRLVR